MAAGIMLRTLEPSIDTDASKLAGLLLYIGALHGCIDIYGTAVPKFGDI
jgi:hypothetical protein